jgi:hypothetical protein
VPLRYILAVVASVLLVIAGLATANYLRHSFVEEFRQSLHEAGAAGKLPKEFDGVDLDTVTPDGRAVKVTASQEARINVAGFLLNLWFIWVPVVFVGCFGIAYLLGTPVTR